MPRNHLTVKFSKVEYFIPTMIMTFSANYPSCNENVSWVILDKLYKNSS